MNRLRRIDTESTLWRSELAGQASIPDGAPVRFRNAVRGDGATRVSRSPSYLLVSKDHPVEWFPLSTR